AIHSPAGNTTSLVLGFPIRTPSDLRSVDNSPRHIAVSHVLHRLPMPRHPPCALIHLQTQKPKMCFNNKIAQTNNNHPHPEKPRNMSTRSSLGCSQPLSTTQTPHPTTKTRRQPTHPTNKGPRACCLRTQQCAWRSLHAKPLNATSRRHFTRKRL